MERYAHKNAEDYQSKIEKKCYCQQKVPILMGGCSTRNFVQKIVLLSLFLKKEHQLHSGLSYCNQCRLRKNTMRYIHIQSKRLEKDKLESKSTNWLKEKVEDGFVG